MTAPDRIAPRWLSLREAAHYSAIGEARLVSMAKSGAVKGFQDEEIKTKPWIFDIRSLDSYREGQAQPTYRERAMMIMEGR